LDWARRSPVSRHLKIGLLGAASDAGAALRVAAERTRDVAAVVLLGGRPEASRDILRRVSAPTLMLVGEKDNAVMLQSRHALDQFHGPRELSVVPGASHLFLEGDTLEVAARAASDWFARHLTPHARSAA
jgi:putative phosphoribosyl transferase